jgi:hypothetical protein
VSLIATVLKFGDRTQIGAVVLTPDDDLVLAPGDELLLCGRPAARRALDTTMVVDAAREYVISGRHVPASWIWRRIAGEA